ncbi:MAG: hypothetical protein M0033_13220 [Nitrospiraceae bacterium]|nr:hypothetical protein [Nitrospiraceae bacterium]
MNKPGANRLLKSCPLLFALILPFLLSSCGNSGNPAEIDINGTWYIYQTTTGPGASEQVQAVPIGMAQGNTGFTMTPPDYTSSGGSEDDSGDVTFSWSDASGNTYSFSGKMNSPSAMSGAWSGSNGESGFWSAIYQESSAVNFGAQWTASYTGNDVSGLPPAFTLTQSSDGNSVTCAAPVINGNIDSAGGNSNIGFYLNVDNVIYVFNGTLNTAASMSGTWENSNNVSGTWSATHP